MARAVIPLILLVFFADVLQLLLRFVDLLFGGRCHVREVGNLILASLFNMGFNNGWLLLLTKIKHVFARAELRLFDGRLLLVRRPVLIKRMLCEVKDFSPRICLMSTVFVGGDYACFFFALSALQAIERLQDVSCRLRR